jgi:hypothetical protein
MGFPLDSTYKTGLSTDTSLGEYLSRPVRIGAFAPTVGAREKYTIDPWTLFLTNTHVQKKIEGFRLLRGNLHIRATITGGPMTYGKWHLCYHPRHLDDSYPEPGATSGTRYIWSTVRPHITLCATESKGGELVLPFFTPNNFIDLYETNDVARMGQLHLYTASHLGHVTSATPQVQITIFAWMENVELCCPTGFASTWTRQCLVEPAVVGAGAGVVSAIFTILSFVYANWERWKQVVREIARQESRSSQIEQADERAIKPVEKVASATARMAGLIGDFVPEIAPLALATEMTASAIGRVAHVFGFSRPATLEPIHRYREFTFGELAPSNTPDVYSRLSYDCKGELTIDPRTVGLSSVDELSIPYLCGINCHVDNVLWDESDSAGGTLCEINVTPMHFQTNTLHPTNSSIMCPMAAISQLFRFWRGTLIFRFTIVASALHRGKIRIIYDPLGDNVNEGFNQVYSRVVDISEVRDIEVPVEWHSSLPWLKTRTCQVGSTTDFNIGSTINNDPNYDNGELKISVLEPLSSPSPGLSNQVRIMVSVRADENIEFAAPASRLGDETLGWRFHSPDPGDSPQALSLSPASPDDDSPVAASNLETIGDVHTSSTNPLTRVYFGESVPSLRTLLKRYAWRRDSAGPTRNHTIRGINSASVPGAICHHEYITTMFSGWRGSTRVKVAQTPETDVQATFEVTSGFAPDLHDLTKYSTANGVYLNRGSAEVEFPYYSNYRFSSARTHPQMVSDYKNFDEFDMNNYRFSVICPATIPWYHYRAVGEDFQLFFFVGLPEIYSVPSV